MHHARKIENRGKKFYGPSGGLKVVSVVVIEAIANREKRHAMSGEPDRKPQQIRQMKRRDSHRELQAVREAVLEKIDKIEDEMGSKRPPPMDEENK